LVDGARALDLCAREPRARWRFGQNWSAGDAPGGSGLPAQGRRRLGRAV